MNDSVLLAENEKLVGEVEFTKGEVIVTDRRIIVTKGKEYYDALLWRIPSIQFKRESKLKYLVWGIIALAIFFLTLMLGCSIFTIRPVGIPMEIYLPLTIVNLISLIAGIILIIAYLLSRKTEVTIYIDAAEPIKFKTKSSKAIVEITKLVRRRKPDVRVEDIRTQQTTKDL